MIGIVLAAGAGRRLQPLTDALPKTLLPVDGDDTLLDFALANLGAAGVTDVVVVTGFAASEIEARLPAMAQRHGVEARTVFNEAALTRNNAYSLWLARQHFAGGALVVNSDTLAPASMVEDVLEAAGSADVVLAVDEVKPLADEEMKVVLDEHGRFKRIHKGVAPSEAWGEYVGISAVAPSAAAALADALEATWQRDPALYYEDGYQELADRGGTVGVVSVGGVDWVEVDDHTDLERARAIRCRS